MTTSVMDEGAAASDGRFRWPVAVAGYLWLDTNSGITELVQLDPSQAPRITFPLEVPVTLFRALAQLTDDLEQMRAFADKWGFLGTGILPGEPPANEYDYNWRAYPQVLAYAVGIFDAISAGDVSKLRTWLASGHADRWHYPFRQHLPGPGGKGLSIDPLLWQAEDSERVAARARSLATWSDDRVLWKAHERLLRVEVAAWLSFDTQPEIVLDAAGRGGRIELMPTSLWSAAWWQFAQAVLGQRQFRRCQQCPNWFEVAPDVARVDKQYCSDACRSAAYRRSPRYRARVARRLRAALTA